MKSYTKYKCTKGLIKADLKKITKYIEIFFQLRKKMIKIKIRKIYTTHINHVAGLPKLVRRDNIFTNRHQSCQPYIYFITYVATR